MCEQQVNNGFEPILFENEYHNSIYFNPFRNDSTIRCSFCFRIDVRVLQVVHEMCAMLCVCVSSFAFLHKCELCDRFAKLRFAVLITSV